MLDNHPTYRLFVPKQAVGASLIYFDFWNATGSGHDILLMSVVPVVSGAVEVTGVLGVDLHLNRTSAIGTGGTAAGFNLSAFTSASIANLASGGAPMPQGITARLTPTGGATAGAHLGWCSVFSEETNAGTYLAALNDLVTMGLPDAPPVIIPQNSGVSVVQGGVASVGNIGYNVGFRLRAK